MEKSVSCCYYYYYLLLFKTLQCTYVYLYHTYKPLQRLSSQVALMVHRQLGLWPMLCILHKIITAN